jgi:hypothetical protein
MSSQKLAPGFLWTLHHALFPYFVLYPFSLRFDPLLFYLLPDSTFAGETVSLI